MADREGLGKFNLVTGEDTYSGQNAQNPATSRRVLSLIPSLNGELVREKGEPLYLPTQLPSKVGAVFQYDYNDASGNQQTKRFAATATQLYMESAGAWVLQSIINPTIGTNTTTPFAKYPVFEIINNLLHFSDGVHNWLYDGPNNAFVEEGFPIPTTTLGITSTASAGNITAAIGRYYWFTFADETAGRVHESSSSPISANTGPLTAKQVSLSVSTDTIATTLGSPTVTSIGAAFTPAFVGKALWIGGASSGFYGILIAFVNASTMTLDRNAFANNGASSYIAVPPRATAIHVYCSESDGSKLGKFLLSSSLTAMSIVDNSAFQNQPNSSILNIDRPIRNDPPPASSVIAAHKYRLFRRRETIPNRFTYSANEEVAAGGNGSPQESVPGTLSNTLSDIINETAYPKQASAIRAIKSHADALYIGTEKEVIPLWGESIDDFALSQVTAVDGGVISSYGLESTSHGLIIFSYDRKLYLYPPVSPIYALTPEDINVTDQLIEIGRSMRSKFLTIKASDIQNVRLLKYRYNTRDWLVVAYQDTNSSYHTYIYDFETKGWFELQRGFVSLAVFETSPGVKILVGGGTDGFVYVVDDLTGAIAPNTTFPTGLFRTALIDFGKPDLLHVPHYLELEVSNPTLLDTTTTINFYLDPQDADNPGTPIALSMSPIQGEPNRYRGFFAAAEGGQGVVCRRLMIELNLTSDAQSGSFRGIILKANPAPTFLR